MLCGNDWILKKHTIAASFPRERPRSILNPDVQLKLAINQYIPVDQSPTPGDITLIFCPGNGLHKELYQPFFDELLAFSRADVSFRIRAIWAFDFVHQGASGILNEKDVGEDPSWLDFSRDLEQMVNTFAEQMPAPRFGIGHSMGGHVIFESTIRNPGLFTAIVGVDPIISKQRPYKMDTHPIFPAVRRRDIWTSKEEAEKHFRSRPFYQAWDPRVLDAFITHGLRALPTHIYSVPPHPPNGVTLATSKHQEALTLIRPNDSPELFHRPEIQHTFHSLPQIQIPILYIYGGKSATSAKPAREARREQNPDAEVVMIDEASHLIPQQYPKKCAELVGKYLAKHTSQWIKEREIFVANPVHQTLYPAFIERLSRL